MLFYFFADRSKEELSEPFYFILPVHLTEKYKELREWEHIEADRRGNVLLRTIQSDAPKGDFLSIERIIGMPTVNEPFLHVDHKEKSSATDDQQKRKEIMRELKEDGEEDFVVL